MLKKIKLFYKDFYNVYLTLLSFLVGLPILAPVLLYIGWTGPAKVIYFIYSFFCHQFSSRSINIFDYQIAWCARDTGIWLGIFLTAVLVKYNKLPSLKWFLAIPFIIPMGLDGGLQTIFTFFNITPVGDLSGLPLYVSNDLSRFITGAIFGIGVGWWISYQIKNGLGFNDPQQTPVEEKEPSNRLILSTSLKLVGIMFAIYVGLVGVWNVTSVQNKPSDFLDFTVKTPSTNFFARRENAICPTAGTANLFEFDCFFK